MYRLVLLTLLPLTLVACDGSIGGAADKDDTGADVDEDGDGYGGADDCDDTDPTIHIDADEICEDVLWDGIVEQMEAAGADLLQLPRYNLQRDDAHHLSRGYPDLQERLFKRHVRFSTAPRHRTHHRMLGASKPIASRSPHILHWGHIRSVDQLAWKSRMRRQHADTDYIEGPGLRSHANWFHHRNQALDAEAVPLPAGPAAYIRQIEAQARRLTFDRDLP